VRSYLGRVGDPAAQALIRWRIATNGDARAWVTAT
jgi:hypothetical protein